MGEGLVTAMAEATPPPADDPKKWTHRWRLRRVMPQLFGKLCRIVPVEKQRGGVFAWNDKLTLEFQDGTILKASRMAIVPLGRYRLTGKYASVPIGEKPKGRV